jgi:hypothetical protein
MGEIAEYFKREKYITRRLSLLILAGTSLVMPLTLAAQRGRISAQMLECILVAVVACIAVAVVFILRRARAKFPKSGVVDNAPLDSATRGKLRRRIWFLEFLVFIYLVSLLYGLSQARINPWVAVVAGVCINLLMQFALIKTILRLKKKLNVAMGGIPATSTGSSA